VIEEGGHEILDIGEDDRYDLEVAVAKHFLEPAFQCAEVECCREVNGLIASLRAT
jgi:hypothetical protein